MKLLSAAIAAVGVAALVLVGATPAMAAGNTIDPGDSMYVIDCDVDYPDFQLLSVVSSTAVSTPIGTGEGDDDDPCAAQPAHNPATGVSYYVRWFMDDDTELGIINVATGVSTVVAAFWELDGEFPITIDVDSIAIGGDGSAYAIASGTLYSLNLATAELTEIGSMSDTGLYAFAWDSVTDKFYAISYDNNVYEVDVSDGTLAGLGSLSFVSASDYEYTYSLQFDQAGTAWIEVDNSFPGGAGLWSLKLSDLAGTVYSGNFTDDAFYTEALLIIPGKPALANTGVDSSVAPLFAGGAALLALAGATLLVVRRRRSA
ncbi:MAG: LPXTG cell wall anchor domain-containing protein [Rhodoglobus sp.]